MFTKVIGHAFHRNRIQLASHQPEDADEAAVITLAAVPGYAHFLQHVQWSYSGGTPTGGMLTIEIDDVVVFQVDITAAGPGGLGLAIPGGINEEMVITLAAGGGSVVGKLNAQYTTESARSR